MELIFIINIVISFTVLLGGFFMKKYSSNDKEMKYGFRTESAKSSFEAWNYANTACGKQWIIIGIVYLILGIPAIFLMYYFKGDNVARALSLVYSVVLIANVAYSCNSVSKELQNKFDEKGVPKE